MAFTAKFYDYRESKRKSIEMDKVSKATREEIAGVKAGEIALVTTYVGTSKTKTTSRYCEVFYVFENKQASVGCSTSIEDANKRGEIPRRLDFIINDVENITAEVESIDGIKKGDFVELRVDAKFAKANRKVRVLALMANGEALVQKIGFGLIDTSSIVYKGEVDRVQASDLMKN